MRMNLEPALAMVFVAATGLTVSGCRRGARLQTHSLPPIHVQGLQYNVTERDCAVALVDGVKGIDTEIANQLRVQGFTISEAPADGALILNGSGQIDKCKGTVGVITVDATVRSPRQESLAHVRKRYKFNAAQPNTASASSLAIGKSVAALVKRSRQLAAYSASSQGAGAVATVSPSTPSTPQPKAEPKAQPKAAPTQAQPPEPKGPTATQITMNPGTKTIDKDWIVAVMDVVDVNADDKKRAVGGTLVKNLGSQLRIFMAQRGVKTIDKSAQEAAMTDAVHSMKHSSYKACYDASCQIELGKALAASHILRSQITRFGSSCVLNAELFDLKQEVTVGASSANGDCEPEGFLKMCQSVVQNLGTN